MEVVGRDRRLDREQFLEGRDPVDERPERLVVLEIADVGADPRSLPLREAERVLQLGPTREQRHRRPAGKRQAGGHVTAGAANERGTRSSGEIDHAHDRVVCAGLDRAVVEQKHVREPSEPLERVLVAVGDRLVGHVRARHHERRAGIREQQVMQRRVREHHSELERTRSDRRGDRGAGTSRGEHDRALRAHSQQLALGCAQLHQRLGRLDRRSHQRERLVLAMLARPQRGNRPFVVGPAGKMEPADTLDRNDRAIAQRARPRPAHRRSATAAIAGRPRHRAARLPARIQGTRSAGRGSAGRRGPRTPPGSACTS